MRRWIPWNWVWVGLALLTLLSCLPLRPQGPFDARDGSRTPGLSLEMPLEAALVEPLAAPLHILAGAPDYRVAAASTFVWVTLGAGVVRVLRDRRKYGNRLPVVHLLFRSASTGLGAALFLALWVGFALMARLPGWRLIPTTPGLWVADLHTHTLASHDGLISGEENLTTHGKHGFSLVAMTEHEDPSGGLQAAKESAEQGSQMDVVPGIEVPNPRGGYLLGLGLRSGVPVVECHRGDDEEGFESHFIEDIHRHHEGAVVALALRLTPEDIQRLAVAGVDGFEIANFGHPDLSPEIHAALLRASHDRGVPLVASSDWHGWGGLFRTWTVIRDPFPGRSTGGAENELVRVLREHRAEAIVPVTAGFLGRPSVPRAIFSPMIETLRYGLELSPLRVVSWWLWVLGLLALARTLSGLAWDAGPAFVALWSGFFGAGLCTSGLTLATAANRTPFSTRVGGEILLLGFVGLSGAALSIAQQLRVRRFHLGSLFKRGLPTSPREKSASLKVPTQ